MMKHHGFRLSTRITIGAIAMVIACALAWILFEEARLRDVYRSGLRTDLQQSLNTEKLRLSQAIDTLHQDVLFLSNTPPVSGIVRAALGNGYDARYGNTSAVWKERLQQIFSAFSTAHPDYYQICFVGVADGGREIVHVEKRGAEIYVTPPALLQAKADRDYFKATLSLHAGNVYLSEFDLYRKNGVIEQPYRPTLRAATPVFTPSGQLFGMLVINMDMRRLLESATSGLPAGARSYISNARGEYLLHPDAPWLFGFELGRKDSLTTNFPFLKTLFVPQTSGHFLFQAVTVGADTQYWLAERLHFDPADPARFLVLAYAMPEAVIAQRAAMLPPEQFMAGIIAMLLAGGIALLVLRRMFAPLEQITAAAAKIAAGDHDVILPQTGSGEIGSLAGALRAMLARLSQREQDILRINAELEERVKERTFELNNINELLHGIKGKKLLQETEKLLRRNQALMQTSMDGIHVLDIHGYIVTANDAFCRMLGYTQEEATRLNVADWETQFSIEEWRARLNDLIGKSALTETRYRRKDGTLFNAEVSSSGVEIEGEYFIFSASRDITERKRMEQALRVAAAAFETQDAIIITDAEGNILRVNQAFTAITGYSSEEVLGKNMGMMNTQQNGQDSCIEMLRQSIHDGSWSGEIFDRRKNGEIYPKWMTVTAIKNELQETTHCVSIFSDITARKRVEEARLRESDERFRGTLEQAAVGIVHVAPDGSFQQLNAKFCDITGYPREDLLHMSFWELTYPADLDKDMACQQQMLAGEISTFSMEKRYVRKDKTLIWVNLTASLLHNTHGTPKYFIYVVEDITGRKHSEAMAQRFGRMLQISFNEIYLFDARTLRFLEVSEGAKNNLGYTIDELRQLTPLDLKPSFTRERFASLLAPLRKGEQQSLNFETLHRRKEGTTYPVEIHLQHMDSEPGAFLAVIRDATERKQAEQQLRALTAHIQTVREEEKASVAREIHDDLGGILTALKMDTYWLARKLVTDAEIAPLRERVESMSGLIINAVGVTRRIITGLRPTILDDLGLLAALEWQADQFSKRTGIACRVSCMSEGGCEIEVGQTQSINLFRIFQESLTNITRHSGASSVEVELQQNDNEITLSISDNGRGLPQGHTIASSSYGIRGMCERAEQLGGSVEYGNHPGGGLRVIVRLPLAADNSKGEEA